MITRLQHARSRKGSGAEAVTAAVANLFERKLPAAVMPVAVQRARVSLRIQPGGAAEAVPEEAVWADVERTG